MRRIGWITVLALLVAPTGVRAADDTSPSYQRHVAALFGKLGCNGGTCHGAVKGQNGFRLSMFAADPTGDHARLVREFGARRLNFFAPEASLLLQKGSGLLPHGGGTRLRVGSPEYVLLRNWIAAGAIADEAAPSRLLQLRVAPAEHVIQPGASYRLQVEAAFADGSTEDVTSLCSFESLARSVATVDGAGTVTGIGVGDAGLIVRYRAQPAAARIIVPRPGGSDIPAVPSDNFIDAQVLAKLRRLNLRPADICDDATFLRRVQLDVTGVLPTPEEVREFLAQLDSSPAKRAAKIEALFARPSHADLWTLKFLDLLKAADFGVYADAFSKEHDTPRMQAWIRARLLENTPYDVFVERILLATSREGRSMDEYAAEVQSLFEGYAPGRPDLELYAKRKTLDLYWQRRGSDGVKGGLQVAHAFLGLRLECAQCHRHPHDNWRQEDLLDFANFFMRVRTVGFQGDNEKKFPDAAVFFQQFNAAAKTLEAEVKTRKEGEGKKLEDEARKARQDVDRLSGEVAKLEKSNGDADRIAEKRRELEAVREVLSRADQFRQETAAREKRAKMLPEVARRLLQGECRLLPIGTNAKVSSTLGTLDSSSFRLLGEADPVAAPAEGDPRAIVMEWMRRPNNPYFARAIVNRVWAHYFGRGLVDPPDNLSAFNPATHPELLQELCDGFVRHEYDLRWLHRAIVTSRTYQQTSLRPADVSADPAHYTHFPLRRLPAEVLLDALNAATGTTESMDMNYHHWPDAVTAVQAPFEPRNPFVTFVLETYGRPQRNAAVQCDCERDGSSSIFQVLTLANHPRVWEKIKDPAGRVAKLLQSTDDDARRAEELFLATVSRPPRDEERKACLHFVAAADSSEQAWQSVLWSLINTREFLLQH